jgi:hypothetical protein
MFSPATINVLPFDPHHGSDQARQYAAKYVRASFFSFRATSVHRRLHVLRQAVVVWLRIVSASAAQPPVQGQQTGEMVLLGGP